jgi:hypothetical protein
MESRSVIETALQPINEDLTRIVCQRGLFTESDILRVMTLMAGIRTRALENGWGPASERDLDEIRSILQSQRTCI